MNGNWYLQAKLANIQHAELLQEAARARLVKLAQGDCGRASILPLIFGWLGKIAQPQLPGGRGNPPALGRYVTAEALAGSREKSPTPCRS